MNSLCSTMLNGELVPYTDLATWLSKADFSEADVWVTKESSLQGFSLFSRGDDGGGDADRFLWVDTGEAGGVAL